MRWPLIFVASILLAAMGIFFVYKKSPANPPVPKLVEASEIVGNSESFRLRQITKGIKKIVQKHNYNSSYCFLIDMKKPSGSKRFFVYDINKDSVVLKGMVTHGSGLTNSDTIAYSNLPGSNCTSLGKYKIGKPYYGKFGLAYKLYGLDKTNSNAFARYVVLHSHACVPDNEKAHAPICCSWGCPTVSPAFLKQLKTYLDKPGKQVMLWIFN